MGSEIKVLREYPIGSAKLGFVLLGYFPLGNSNNKDFVYPENISTRIQLTPGVL